MAGLCAPLSTLRRHPRGYRRMTRGQCGSLDLHCERLALSTPCRSSRRTKNHNITWLRRTSQTETMPQYQSLDSRERGKLRLRCSPAEFEVGPESQLPRSPVRRFYFSPHQYQILCRLRRLWVCGRGRAFPRFPSLLGKRGKRSRSAKPIVHISTGRPGKFAAACDSRGSGAGAPHCTKRRDNAHKIEGLEVLYPWHPWFGRVVHVHEVIEKRAGGVLHGSSDGDASRPWLELPQWMFDRAACLAIRMAASPRVDTTALIALKTCLAAASGAGFCGRPLFNCPSSWW